MLKRYLKNEKGLTLIELLVVIVILGIIAAIAIPAIGNLIKNSENDAAVAEGIQIISAAKLYIASESPTAGTTTLDHSVLTGYLDNIEEDNTDYSVTVTRNATSGTYTYALSSHPSVALAGESNATSVTEASLLDY